jgi:hypothetical protein
MARHDEKKQGSNGNLRGTLVSVLLVGAVIVLIWSAVFALLMDRY